MIIKRADCMFHKTKNEERKIFLFSDRQDAYKLKELLKADQDIRVVSMSVRKIRGYTLHGLYVTFFTFGDVVTFSRKKLYTMEKGYYQDIVDNIK